jgi:polysaccharide export outer membrane protein
MAVVGLCACGTSGSYIWVEQAPEAFFKPNSVVEISTGDLISVRVFGQEPISVRTIVRTDGKIAVPLIGEVDVSGKYPNVVAKELEARLVPFVNSPNVTIVVEESHTNIVAIGEIQKKGTITLAKSETDMLSALANAGGLTEFASENGIYVLRNGPQGVVRIRFQYEEIIRGEGKAAAFKLKSGDQLVVE